MIGFTYQHETDSPIARSDLPEEVVDWYHRSLEAGHTNPDIVNSLGDIYLRSGRVQEAITCFSQVAEIYRAKGYVSKSVAVLKKISRLAPRDTALAMRIGDLLVGQGRAAEARTSYLCAGDSHYMSDAPDLAIAAYERAIDLDESNAALHMMLGGLYLDQNMPKKAHSSFVSARREYLKRGEVDMARYAGERARSIENSEQLRLYQDACRRREERYPLRLRTVVMGENRKWCQYTESMNISKSGIRFGLDYPVQRDRMVGLLLNLPSQLGLSTVDDSTYAVDAIICNIENGSDGKYVVGAEFGAISSLGYEFVF